MRSNFILNRRIGARRIALLWLWIVWLTALPAFGESPEVIERHVKSAFIYQFTKLFTWPPKQGPFVIFVIDDEELLKVLSGVVQGKTVGARPIKVQSSILSKAIIEPSDVLVLPKKYVPNFNMAFEKLSHKPCLIIAQTEGMAVAGATINFVMKDQKLRFELNQKSLKNKSLIIDDKLLKLALVVD